MLKKKLAVLTLTLFTASIFAACSNQEMMLEQPMIDNGVNLTEQDNQVAISSWKGVYKEIQKSNEGAFKELDKNKDKVVTPDEYGVSTPDSLKAFYALDDNRDGKVTASEWTPNFFKRVGLTFRLRKAASNLFDQLDRDGDKMLAKEEMNSPLISQAFLADFDKYDKQKKTLLHKDVKGKLSKSEFEELFAHLAVNNIGATQPPAPPTPPSVTPTSAPVEPPTTPTSAPVEPPTTPTSAPVEPPSTAPSAPAPAVR